MSLCKKCEYARRLRGETFTRCGAPGGEPGQWPELPRDGYDRCPTNQYQPDFLHMTDETQPNELDTAQLVYRAYERADTGARSYLGMSEVGHPCSRALWYGFRQVQPRKFEGRLLRLFNTGHRAEDRMASDLRSIGCDVHTHEPDGKQFEFVGYKGHVKGHMDGALSKLPAAPKDWHVLEGKTHNDKSFNAVKKDGVMIGKPLHYAQMQMYMGYSGMDRALYFAENKNTDELYIERVHFNKRVFEQMKARAAEVIDAATPPSRISTDPSWYECKMCDYHDICWRMKAPAMNCRTCARSTPIDNGKWTCERHGEAVKPCGDHLYIPDLMGITPEDGSEDFVAYAEFINATETAAEGNAWEGRIVHTSKQIEQAGNLGLLGDPTYLALRETFK